MLLILLKGGISYGNKLNKLNSEYRCLLRGVCSVDFDTLSGNSFLYKGLCALRPGLKHTGFQAQMSSVKED